MPLFSGKPQAKGYIKASIENTVSCSQENRSIPVDKFLDLSRRMFQKILVVAAASENKEKGSQQKKHPYL